MASTQKKSKPSLLSPTKPSGSSSKGPKGKPEKEDPAGPTTSTSQNPETPVTKRLHISGLTPAITLDDLNRRLSTFGSVEAVDGMGRVDAVGRPRAFAYVTLNTNVGKLSRCMNVLSGSTWKGAKLRIAEAKPDYRERLAAEREAAASAVEKPKRKRQRVDGVHAADMSLITPDSAAQKSGWKVTEMGRVLRTIRMRPDHPLPPTLEERAKAKSAKAATAGTHYTKGKKSGEKGKDGNGKDGEKRKRKKDLDVRARRVMIDVTKWESSLLKGMFLESQGAMPASGTKKEDIVEDAGEGSSGEEEGGSEEESSESEEEEEEEEEDVAVQEDMRKPTTKPLAQPPMPASLPPPPSAQDTPAPSTTRNLATNPPDTESTLAHEKSAALSLLSSLFGNADEDEDWVVNDAMDSDIDEEEILKAESKARENVVRSGANVAKGDVEFEVVPREKSAGGVKRKVEEVIGAEEEDEEEEEEPDRVATQAAAPAQKEAESEPAPQSAPNLKDMFAPREEDGGFSLLGHLDLDLEIDEELALAFEGTAHSAAEPSFATPAASFPTPSLASKLAGPTSTSTSTYINPREPLFFFPSASSLSSHTSAATEWKNAFQHFNPQKKNKDALDVMVEKGWYWRDPKVAFYRTESEEEIRKKWEERKGELTRGWKRRAREAGKVGRRRKGGRGAEEDV